MASGGGDLLVSVKTLTENSKDVFLKTSEVILRIIRNIMKDPKNPKYRRLRVSTTIFTEKLLPVNGALDCLFEIGFQEDGDFFSLPESIPINSLSLMREQLELHQRISSGSAPQPEAQSVSTTPPTTQASQPVVAAQTPRAGPSQQPVATRPNSTDKLLKDPAFQHPLLQMQMQFFQKLESGMKTVLAYEDSALQTQAQMHMPLDKLRERASLRWSNIAREDGGEGVGMKDILVLEMLAWFKSDFFTWVDAPPCEACGGGTVSVGMASPTPAEIMWGAGRVENYRCQSCHQFTRFPRYNHPGMLLETRRGRCGEWANCFTLCCRAAGFEARYVLDWTDHVWTEVYSDHQERWLHCDPCENTCDKPLVYEAGWGKQLTYVMAFSKDGVQDVTWRYSARHPEVLARRKEVSESWLLLTTGRMRDRFWASLSPARRDTLRLRLVVEIVEFLTVKGAVNESYGGRVSGSMAWRSMRGEVGAGTPAVKRDPVTITLSEREREERMIHIKYSSATDKYIRGKDGESVSSGWAKMVHQTENIMRKVESDWKMSYLARTEGSESATISWKFDFTDSGLVIDDVDVTADDSRFESGQIIWRVCSEKQCAFLPPGGTRSVMADFAGSCTLTLVAHLKGGNGDCAWQHTQLFRQKEDDLHSFPLNILIKLKDREDGAQPLPTD